VVVEATCLSLPAPPASPGFAISGSAGTNSTWRAAKAEGAELSEATVREALERLDPLWEELFPAEQARIVQLLVQRVEVKPDGLELRLRTQGLGHLVKELGVIRNDLRKAA
jgi:hypothetical protein